MSLRILLVDDNHTFLAAVRQCLAMLPDAEVVGQAKDGAEALRLAESLQPDLVLLDIVMPHMNGLEVAAHIQTWEHAPHIVFLSLHDNLLAAVQMRVNLAEFETDVGTTKGPIGPFAFTGWRTSQLRTIHRPLWMRPLRTV